MMEVFAACGAQTDHVMGRIIDAVKQRAGGENTVFIYIAGDNSASAEGRLEGGIRLYPRDGRPTFVHNFLSLERPTFVAKEPLPKGKSQVAVKFDYDGGGAGNGATDTLLVNGEQVASGRLERTVPAQFCFGEGFDVGMDHGSAVDFTCKLPFKFTGKIEEVRVELE